MCRCHHHHRSSSSSTSTTHARSPLTQNPIPDVPSTAPPRCPPTAYQRPGHDMGNGAPCPLCQPKRADSAAVHGGGGGWFMRFVWMRVCDGSKGGGGPRIHYYRTRLGAPPPPPPSHTTHTHTFTLTLDTTHPCPRRRVDRSLPRHASAGHVAASAGLDASPWPR